jgi:hypothetical protein
MNHCKRERQAIKVWEPLLYKLTPCPKEPSDLSSTLYGLNYWKGVVECSTTTTTQYPGRREATRYKCSFEYFQFHSR